MLNHWYEVPVGRHSCKGDTLQWRHNEHDGISNHRCLDCLLNRVLRHRSKKASKLCITGLCAGNLPVTGEFPAQRASNAENVSIWWRHHEMRWIDLLTHWRRWYRVLACSLYFALQLTTRELILCERYVYVIGCICWIMLIGTVDCTKWIINYFFLIWTCVLSFFFSCKIDSLNGWSRSLI